MCYCLCYRVHLGEGHFESQSPPSLPLVSHNNKLTPFLLVINTVLINPFTTEGIYYTCTCIWLTPARVGQNLKVIFMIMQNIECFVFPVYVNALACVDVKTTKPRLSFQRVNYINLNQH